MASTHFIKRGKAFNKIIEDARIDYIVKSINENTPFGRRLRENYKSHFGTEIIRVDNSMCGGNNSHYDMMIKESSGKTLRCEEKHTSKPVSSRDFSKSKPWNNSVQAVNITLSKVSMAHRYGKLYYTDVIVPSKNEYGIETPLPTFEEYLKKDFFHPGVSSPYMKQLKSITKGKHGEKAQINKIWLNKVDKVNRDFACSLTPREKTEFIDYVQKKINTAFNDKDCWLQTSGLIPDINASGEYTFEKSSETATFMWSSQKDVYVPKIMDIHVTASLSGRRYAMKSAILNLTYDLDNKTSSSTYLRFRNFLSNFSTDYK